jgi:hypothetical protein
MLLLVVSLYVAIVASSTIPRGAPRGGNGWVGKEFESLVAFGDSYTDEQRISYFSGNNGSAPPVGWVEPVVSFPLSFPSDYFQNH